MMSRSTSTQLRHSLTKPELSPASFQSAAAAEADTLRRLRREVLGLTLAVDSLKKNSKEWEFLHSKLEVAKEELDAVLEDEQLFRIISPEGGVKKTLTTKSISEEKCNELLEMIPTPPLTPPQDSPNRVEELEEKLRQQVKYSLEWFETKKQIDTERKKCKHDATVNVNLNKKYFRSSSMGAIVSPARREGPKRLPSTGTGASKSERLRPTVMSSIKDQNIQGLKDLLDNVPKYSLEWFEIKRILHRRSNKNPTLKTVQRKQSLGAAQVIPTKDVATQSQQKQHDVSPTKDNMSYRKDAEDSTDFVSRSMTEQPLSVTDDLDADLELIIPYSREYHETKKIIHLLQANN